MKRRSIELMILFLFFVALMIVLAVLLNEPDGVLSWAKTLIGMGR